MTEDKEKRILHWNPATKQFEKQQGVITEQERQDFLEWCGGGVRCLNPVGRMVQ